MMRIASSAPSIALAGASSLAYACNDHETGTELARRADAQTGSFAAGEVREIDLDDGTLTLGPGKVSSLRMAPMSTMLFQVSDPNLLTTLKPGDKVSFRAAMIGQLPTVTQINRAK